MTRTPAVDWESAFAFYAALGPTRTFVAVAHKFGVSDTAVRNQARARNWQRRVGRIDAEAVAKVDRRITADRAKAIEATLRVIDLARSELLERLDSGVAEVRVSDLPALVKLEQLLVGEPTDRIEVREVREYVRLLIERVGVLVPREHMGEYVALVERVAFELESRDGLPDIEPMKEPAQ